MKVSIITATYNSGDTIVDTVSSLEEQTYQDIEYILVDGASKDDTVALAKANSSRISTVISEPDSGIYDALNKGIAAATGDIVGFLHSDDVFAYPEAVADLVDSIQSSNAQAVYGDLEYVSKDDMSHVVRRWTSGECTQSRLQHGWMPPHPTFYMQRELYTRYGAFDLDLKISADYDSLLRYLWTNKVTPAYLPKVVTKMRVGGASNRSFSNIMKKTREDIKALNNNGVSWGIAIIVKNVSKIPQFFRR